MVDTAEAQGEFSLQKTNKQRNQNQGDFDNRVY